MNNNAAGAACVSRQRLKFDGFGVHDGTLRPNLELTYLAGLHDMLEWDGSGHYWVPGHHRRISAILLIIAHTGL